MRTLQKRWWMLAAGAALVAGVFAVSYAVEGVVADRARERLASFPGTVDWSEVHWFWGPSVTIYGVEITHERRGSLEAERVEVQSSLGELLRLRARLDGVAAQGVRGTLRLGQSSRGEERETEGRTVEERPDSGVPSAVRELSSVRVSDASVDLFRRGRRIGRVEGRFSLRSGGRATGKGVLRLERSERRRTVDWSLDGSVDLDGGTVRGELDLGADGSESTATVEYGPVRMDLTGLTFSLRGGLREPQGRVSLRDYRVSVGSGTQPGLRAEGPELSFRAGGGSAVRVDATSMRAVVAPRRLLATLRSSGASRPTRGGPSASVRRQERGWRSLYARFVRDVDVTFTGLGLEVRVRDEEGWKSYRPADEIQIRKRGEAVAVAGGFAGGRLLGRVELSSAHLLPDAASLRMGGVELEEIPVVREGRSLPNRGVRGEIGGKVDLSAHLLRRGAPGTLLERLRAALDVRWHQGWVEADGLARQPVRGIDTSIDLSLEWQPALDRIRLRDTRFEFGPVTLDVRGRFVDWGLDPFLSIEAEAREIECQRAVHALPEQLLGPYRDVELDGETAPVMRFEFPVDRPTELSFEFRGLPGRCSVEALHARRSGWPDLNYRRRVPLLPLGVRTASKTPTRQWAAAPDPSDPIDPPADLEPIPADWNQKRPDDVFWLRKPFVKRVTEGVSDDARVRVGPGLDSYVPLERLPAHAAAAAYLSEEINFYDGGPWNTRLIQKALQLNFEERRFVYGGSTVTQQLVKNLFLTRRKTLARKVQEALIAWRLQDVVSKDRVLELYLNCIEFGNDLYGIGPAAKFYFQKPARELSILEGVFLAVLKPAPWFGNRFKERGTTPTSGWWRDRIREIVGRLVQKGFITEAEAAAAEPYVLKWDDSGRYQPDRPSAGPDSESEKDDGSEAVDETGPTKESRGGPEPEEGRGE